MKTSLALICFCVFLGFLGNAAFATERVLDDAAWRADIDTVARSIREIHPRPFRDISDEDFRQQHLKLIDDVPSLSDKAITVRLAALVGLINDGHTRLTIPREHPEIGLEFGHTQTSGPERDELKFKQLPLAFEKLEDGVFITAASSDFARLIGYQVRRIDDTPISKALEIVQAVTFAENSQLEALMGADRLSLVEVLAELGVSQSAEQVTLELIDPDGVMVKETLRPLPPGPLNWVDAFAASPKPLRLKHPEKVFWSEYVDTGNYVYLNLDEITDADISLAEFVTAAVRSALERDAKLIIDVRNNFGGSGGMNKTLVMLIIQNDELNHYDRTSVLTGRRTFSAAQMLVNELEQYTRVSFVGEPTGSRPDLFGDPKKIRLEHSGLTLRVSRLHWSSYTAFDEREASYPDFLVNWTSDAYFSGEDPALLQAVSLSNVSLKELLRSALRRGDMTQIGRYTLDSKYSPQTFGTDFSEALLELGNDFAKSEEPETASLAYQIGLYFYPEHAALRTALGNLP